MKRAGGPAPVRTAWGSGREAARNGSLGSGPHLEPFFYQKSWSLEQPKVRGEDETSARDGSVSLGLSVCFRHGGIGVGDKGGTLPSWGDPAGGFPASACSLLADSGTCCMR